MFQLFECIGATCAQSMLISTIAAAEKQRPSNDTPTVPELNRFAAAIEVPERVYRTMKQGRCLILNMNRV